MFGPEGAENTAWARRFRDLVCLHQDDVGSPESLSESQISLVRRCAALEVVLEGMEADLSSGRECDLDLYQRATNTLGRQLERLGIRRAARDVSMDLQTYIASKNAEAAE